MLPPGHSAGALTRDAAQALIDEIERLDRLAERYREVIAQVRKFVDDVDTIP